MCIYIYIYIYIPSLALLRLGRRRFGAELFSLGQRGPWLLAKEQYNNYYYYYYHYYYYYYCHYYYYYYHYYIVRDVNSPRARRSES